MLRHSLIFMLTLLIALQSIGAVADVHKIHQAKSAHLVPDNNTASSEPLQTQQSEQANSATKAVSQADCSHCCHCHGSAPIFLVKNQQATLPAYQTSKVFFYNTSYQSYIAFPDSPPPIA